MRERWLNAGQKVPEVEQNVPIDVRSKFNAFRAWSIRQAARAIARLRNGGERVAKWPWRSIGLWAGGIVTGAVGAIVLFAAFLGIWHLATRPTASARTRRGMATRRGSAESVAKDRASRRRRSAAGAGAADVAVCRRSMMRRRRFRAISRYFDILPRLKAGDSYGAQARHCATPESLRWVPAAGGMTAPLTSQANRACPALNTLIAPTTSAWPSNPHSTHLNSV